MLKRFSAALLAGAVLAACSESVVPTGPETIVPEAANQSLLAELTCRVEVASSSMSCAPARASAVAGRSTDLILGGQNTYVRLANTTKVVSSGIMSFDVTIQNLTGQRWATADGTTPEVSGVRVFFSRLPEAPVTINNATGTGTFTASGQPYFEYTGLDFGGNSILAGNETSSPRTWEFVLNGATGFTFTVFISTKMPDEQGVLLYSRTVLSKAAGSEARRAIWGTSPSDVWTGGTAGATALHHWDGTSWTASPDVTHQVEGIWGSAANNVYAVGGSSISQYDGTTWTAHPSVSSNLLAVWGTGSDVYVGGDNATLLKSSGGGAFAAVSGTSLAGTDSVVGIWGSDANNVYIVGSKVERWDGTSWTVVNTGLGNTATDVWGSGANDVYVGGFNGALVHWDGTTWSAVTGCGTADVGGIWGTGPGDVYMVNEAGEVCHKWDIKPFAIYTQRASSGFNAIWGSGRLDVWYAGDDRFGTDNVVVRGTR